MVPDDVVTQIDVLVSAGSHVVGAELNCGLVIFSDVYWSLHFNADLLKKEFDPHHLVQCHRDDARYSDSVEDWAGASGCSLDL